MTTFLFDYNYKGSKYTLEIKADTLDEAIGRKNRMAFAEYVGELQFTIAKPLASSLLASLICWWKNLKAR